MSKLDDIITGLGSSMIDSYSCYTAEDVPEYKQQIKELFLELIGADVSTYSDPDDTKPNKYLQAENRLRRELRKEVEEL